MYHIKNDKRTLKSSELIYEGLLKCLEIKEFNKITISDIEHYSTISRSTFYRLFDSLEDILSMKCDYYFKEVLGNYITHPNAKNGKLDFVKYFFNYWFEHSKLLEILFSINRIDIIYNSISHNSHILTDFYKSKSTFPIKNLEYSIAIRTGIFLVILFKWIQNGKKETVDELVEILGSQLVFLSQSDLIF